ncbi:LacI family DNA-binding transcriptional regulator [Homoserinibacter sp. YIM 151385]|uniref:LacI family DNA-binding transcriptional regulator n=1 Tax=Homoserinibacter sp. YIM 151385 TaxID=2985506 RepID=UPI0022F1258D|nr:LacI family DNA-binding transcriptional regulator [Homoserinibacter sp. YIM 151385]WBU37947.1 LacI family DNA-binding transcriptional regulator [Homoserinibacter sp. YIM 151385]
MDDGMRDRAARDGRNVREIAALAGVSTATVSRVYRGVGAVSPQMREKVLQAIQEFDYRPSHFGQALAKGRHNAIGIAFPGLSGPYFAELIRGLEEVAVERRLSVHILGTHLQDGAAAELAEMSRRVDGLIVHGGTIPAARTAELARRAPLVVVGAEPGTGPVSVRTDNDPLRELVRHLIEDHGRTRLVFVGTPEGSPDMTERWATFRAVHEELGLRAPEEPVRVGFQQSDGVLAADQVLASRADGAVCANDETALGLLVGVLGRGVRVPEDLAITGVDDVQLASMVTPSLTTLRRPLAEIGARAARLLLDIVEGREVPVETVLPTEVVRRGSCGCPEPAAAGPGDARPAPPIPDP